MRVLLVVLLAALATPARAQINTEQLRKRNQEGLHLQLDAGGGYARGNTDFLQLSLGARLDAVKGRESGFALARYTLAEANGDTDVSNMFAHVRYNSKLTPLIVGEVFAQAERNAQQLLEHRYLFGGGVRLEFVETEAVGVALGTTPMLEFEQLAPEAMEDPTQAFRWSNYLALRVDVSDTAEAFGVVYVQPRLEAISDYRIFSESRLDLKVSENLKVRLRGLVRYDSQPPLGVEETDITILTGFVFNSQGS